jgi:hypothetical protein
LVAVRLRRATVLQLRLAQPRRWLAHVAALDDQPPGVLLAAHEPHSVAFQSAALAPEEGVQEHGRRRRRRWRRRRRQ